MGAGVHLSSGWPKRCSKVLARYIELSWLLVRSGYSSTAVLAITCLITDCPVTTDTTPGTLRATYSSEQAAAGSVSWWVDCCGALITPALTLNPRLDENHQERSASLRPVSQ
jgi:hypothetical protein